MDDGLPWHVIEQDGSVSEQSTEELAIRIRDGSVSSSSYIWRAGMSDWLLVGQIPGLRSPPEMSNDVPSLTGDEDTGKPWRAWLRNVRRVLRRNMQRLEERVRRIFKPRS